MTQAIYWFRRDCRLEDNLLFFKAIEECQSLLPVYIDNTQYHHSTQWGFVRQGDHAKAFKRQLLLELRQQLESRGSLLWLAEGEPTTLLISWCRALNIYHIYTESIAAEEEEQEIKLLESAGISVHSLCQSTMLDRELIKPVLTYFPMSFTRFRQKIEALGLRFTEVSEANLKDLRVPLAWHKSEWASRQMYHDLEYTLDKRTSLPLIDGQWITHRRGIEEYLTQDYINNQHIAHYKATRNQLQGPYYSSKWSVWLAHGIISARQLMSIVEHYEKTKGANESTYWLWFELLWRDYFRHLFYQRTCCLFRYQGLATQDELAPVFNPEHFAAWSQGNTGIDLIDAAMLELNTTGYLSNRLRQVVASYWIYHYGGDWRAGAAWFESQLIDYDVYSNYGNWLYIAGKGTDPRGGREFNVEKQIAHYDAEGLYRRTWL